MNKLLFAFLPPLAIACTSKKVAPVAVINAVTAKPSVQDANNTPAAPWRSVFGVVQLEKQCPLTSEKACLKVVGGDDLNDTQTLWIGGKDSEFEIAGDEYRLRSTENRGGVVLHDHTPVQLLGQVEQTPTGEKRLTKIQSVALLEK